MPAHRSVVWSFARATWFDCGSTVVRLWFDCGSRCCFGAAVLADCPGPRHPTPPPPKPHLVRHITLSARVGTVLRYIRYPVGQIFVGGTAPPFTGRGGRAQPNNPGPRYLFCGDNYLIPSGHLFPSGHALALWTGAMRHIRISRTSHSENSRKFGRRRLHKLSPW
jgi:hypothetical protein